MSEVSGNNLVERDAQTNAIIPVMQIYSENMENKEVEGNYLVVRDLETNARIPVVKVQGMVSDTQNEKFKGYYPTESLLKSTYPTPKSGEYAYVGTPYPGTVYEVSTDGTWTNTGVTPPAPEEEDWQQGW
jgi:signal peptidase I